MGKTAVITGASRGIGAAIAEKLASEHWDVALLARKPQADGDAQCAEIARKYGVAARYYVCDISKADDREKTVGAVIRDFGGIDALVNNAGVAPNVRADLLDMTEESFDRV
ncbi:MAG: SDR family NAD(P)-dependent oxidoreductase, partial [Lentisphaeria bacterium]|nr:SDR family NAD(P)-dependent oxidoreductase [Lentisphaeria bacterium]